MVIKRKGNDFGLTTEVIEIELTPQELEQAYRIKEKEYCMQEAEQVLQNAYENGQVDTVSYILWKEKDWKILHLQLHQDGGKMLFIGLKTADGFDVPRK